MATEQEEAQVQKEAEIKKANEQEAMDAVKAAPKSSLQSPVTTDIPNTPVNTDEAVLSEYDEAALDKQNNDPMVKAMDAGIGLIKTLGTDMDYVGVAPGREKDPKTPDGLPISPSRSTFTPLASVPFAPSIRVKDPASGKFYFPPDGCMSWEGCNLDGSYLIPKEANPEHVAARRKAKIESLGR